MEFLKVMLLFLFFKCNICESEAEPLVTPCAVKDIECLRNSTHRFLAKTAAGIPKYDIKPIDPAFLPMVSVKIGEHIILYYKNVIINGLKNLNLSEFKLDSTAKSVAFSTKQDVDITADVLVELKDPSKTFNGTYIVKASNTCNINYKYSITKDDKGVEHFVISPETIHCDTPYKPKVTLNDELKRILATDPDAKSKMEEYRDHVVEKGKDALSKMMEEAFVLIVHNIRAVAKLLPKSAFFINSDRL